MSHGDNFTLKRQLFSITNRTAQKGGLALCVLIFIAVGFRGAFAQDEVSVPEGLKVPPEQHLVLRGHASGDQIYACQPPTSTNAQFAWVLSAPEAKLFDGTGKEIATHFAGPTWRSIDGSQVKGKVVAQAAPDPNSIPWLLLTAVDHSGNGVMGDVVTIQRLETRGGKAPASGCDVQHQGEQRRVNYTADYYFYSLAK